LKSLNGCLNDKISIGCYSVEGKLWVSFCMKWDNVSVSAHFEVWSVNVNMNYHHCTPQLNQDMFILPDPFPKGFRWFTMTGDIYVDWINLSVFLLFPIWERLMSSCFSLGSYVTTCSDIKIEILMPTWSKGTSRVRELPCQSIYWSWKFKSTHRVLIKESPTPSIISLCLYGKLWIDFKFRFIGTT
jgi:hypothetical protein